MAQRNPFLDIANNLLHGAGQVAQNVGRYVQQDFNRLPAVQAFNNITHVAQSPQVQKFGSNVVKQTQNYFNPQSNAGQNFWSTPTAQRMASVQNTFNTIAKPFNTLGENFTMIKTDPKFAQALPGMVNKGIQGAATSVYGDNRISRTLGQTVGGIEEGFTKLLVSDYTKKNPFEKVGDILTGVGAVAKPGTGIGFGAFGAGLKGVENFINSKPLTQGMGEAYDESLQSGFQFAALEPFTNKLLSPLTKKIAPTEIKNINTYLNLANKATSQKVRDGLLRLTAKRIAQNLGKEALIGGTSFGTIGLLSPAKDNEERIYHALSNGLTGAAFSAGSTGLKYGSQAFGEQLFKPALKYLQSPKGQEGKIGFGEDIWKEKSIKDLRNLMQYETSLRHLGYSQDQIRRISAPEAKKIISENIAPFEHRTFRGGKVSPKEQQLEGYTQEQGEQALLRAEYETGQKKDVFDNLFSKWIGEREVAKTTGIETGSKFRKIPTKEGPDVIKVIENPDARVSPSAKASAKELRTEFDRLYQDANDAGLDTNYLKNYITHIWDRPTDEVAQMYKGASQKFKFSQDRVLPTYEEGLKMGLKPKYSNPSQIIATYSRRLEETKANVELIKQLKSEGLIVPSSVAAGRPGFYPLTGAGFPRSISQGPDGKTYQGHYYATQKIADQLNRVFSPQDYGKLGRAAEIGAKASGVVQDITLSGGIPKTPLNAWTFAQTTKEVLAGRVMSPLKALVRSTVGDSDQYFRDNVGQIKKMQARNIPLGTTMNIENLPDKGTLKNMFGESGGEVWNKTVNEPTFKKFMPQLQIQLFNDVEKSVLKKTNNPELAADIAAKTVKNFYGITGTDTLATRNKLGQDFIGSIFFAPRYRESMISFWTNIVKGLKNPLATENKYNMRFAVGATLTLGAMNYINEKTMGHPMWDNPKSHRDKLLIPLGDGNVIGVPFLSSIATLPRFAAKQAVNIANLDFPEVLNESKTLLSSAIRPPLDILTNQNYFGQEIYNTSDSKGKQMSDIARNLFESYQHPYVRAASEAGLIPGVDKKDQPGYATISKALELPFRFTTEKKIGAGYYYDSVEQELKKLSPEKRQVYDTVYQKDEDMDMGEKLRDNMAEAQLLLANPDVLETRKKIEEDSARKTGQTVNPFFKLTKEQQMIELTRKSLPPGDPTKSAITTANIEWMKPYWTANSAFYDELKSKGVFEEKNDSNDYFQTPPQTQKLLDAYYALPYGTGQRSAMVRQFPQLVTYWDEKRDFTNKQRLSLGLPPLEDKSFSSYAKKPRKGRKPKKFAVKKVKLKGFKTSSGKLKKLKIKPIDTSFASIVDNVQQKKKQSKQFDYLMG